MSWKRGSRSKRRIAEISKALAEVDVQRTDAQRLKNTPSDALFFEDTKGSSRGVLAAARAARTAAAAGKGASKKAKKPVKVAGGRRLKPGLKSIPRPKPKPRAGAAEPTTDLWADEDGSGAPVKPSRRSKAAKRKPASVAAVPVVAVPAPGTSYNPEFEDHQDALGEVVGAAMEEAAKREALAKAITPDPRMLRHIMRSKDDDTTGSAAEASSESEGEAAAGAGAGKKQPRRVTTVQRNRRARVAAEEKARLAAKKERAFLAQVDRLKAIKRELAALEQERKESRTAKAALKLQQEKEEIEALLLTKPEEVALSEELTGSLRTTKSRGAALVLKDRYQSLVHRKLVTPSTAGQMKRRKQVRVLRNK